MCGFLFWIYIFLRVSYYKDEPIDFIVKSNIVVPKIKEMCDESNI